MSQNRTHVERDIKAKRSRNIFNLSQRVESSAPFGMLVPCFVKSVIPKSKFEISLENQTTARPLVTRCFARMREHFDYFFVPYSQLWKPFDNFITQQSNMQSSQLRKVDSGRIPAQVPYLDNQTMAQNIIYNDLTGNDTDAAGYNLQMGLRRIAEYLEYGRLKNRNAQTPPTYPNLRYNVFNALAYQKIYYDFYRNDYYEAYNTEAFNIDDLSGNMAQVSNSRLLSWFTPHYRWRKKDYFTLVTPDVLPNSSLDNFLGFLDNLSYPHTLPSTSIPSGRFVPFNVSGGTTSQGNQSTQEIVKTGSDPTSTAGYPFGSDVIYNTGTNNSSLQYQSQAYHKFAAAREAYLKRIFAAKRNYNSVMQAIFGISPNTQRTDRVYHIGGFSQVLGVDGINNTSETGEQAKLPTGQINFYLNNSKKLHFTAEEHGVIMCIYSTSIENDYRPYRIDRMNFRSVPEDFFNPFYENVGKQALYAAEYNYNNSDDSTQDPQPLDQVRILGFVNRYSDYKTSVDVVHGALATDQMAYFSVFKNEERDLSEPLNISDLIENPSMVVHIFAGGEYASDPLGDHFYLNMYHRVKMIAPMQPITNF